MPNNTTPKRKRGAPKANLQPSEIRNAQLHSIKEDGPAANLEPQTSPQTIPSAIAPHTPVLRCAPSFASQNSKLQRTAAPRRPEFCLAELQGARSAPGRYNAYVARIILFDVDQTLLYSGGAGSLAMRKAFHQLHGVPDAFGKVEFSGLTDWAILKAGMIQHGVHNGNAIGNDATFHEYMHAFQLAYFPLVEPTLREVEGGHVKPGVPALLDALAEREDARLGLATGNFREACFIKLRHFELDTHLTEGGFGDDAEDRGELVGIAIQRVANGTVADPDAGAIPDPSDVWVIGDTIRDITAASANGARSLGVTTGSTSREELQAAGATIVLPDLADTEFVLQVLLE